MKAVLVIAKRELQAAFDSAAAWVVIAALPAITALFFFVSGPFFDQGVASMRAWFSLMPILMVLIAPALSMRMWSEELRSGTFELLRSYPFSVIQLVVGKFLACWSLLAISLLFTLGVPFSIAALGDLDWGPVIGGYVGTMLMGGAAISCGLLFSALTRNQVVAWLLAAAVLLVFLLVGAAATSQAMPPSLGRILLGLDWSLHFEATTRGVLAFRDLAFFCSFGLAFLGFNALALQLRRLQ